MGCATLTPEEKALRASVVGEYERNPLGKGIFGTLRYALKQVYLDNGIRELYTDGKKTAEYKWSIVKEEIQVDWSGSIVVYRINKDKNITEIAGITDGIRGDFQDGWTFKKIK